MSNSIIIEFCKNFSNAYPLALAGKECFYGLSSPGNRLEERLSEFGFMLPEGEFIGLQLSYAIDIYDSYMGCVFTSNDVELSRDDREWILGSSAFNDTSKVIPVGCFSENRKVYALKPIKDVSIPEGQGLNIAKPHLSDQSRFEYIKEMTDLFVYNGAALRVIAGSGSVGSVGWWMVFLSLPRDIPPRMRTVVTKVFPNTIITEIDAENNEQDTGFHIKDSYLREQIGDIINCLMFELSDTRFGCYCDFCGEDGYCKMGNRDRYMNDPYENSLDPRMIEEYRRWFLEYLDVVEKLVELRAAIKNAVKMRKIRKEGKTIRRIERIIAEKRATIETSEFLYYNYGMKYSPKGLYEAVDLLHADYNVTKELEGMLWQKVKNAIQKAWRNDEMPDQSDHHCGELLNIRGRLTEGPDAVHRIKCYKHGLEQKEAKSISPGLLEMDFDMVYNGLSLLSTIKL